MATKAGNMPTWFPTYLRKVYCHKIHVAILDDYYYLGLFGFLYLNGYDGYDASQKISIQEEF
jgi:hypothetical protein